MPFFGSKFSPKKAPQRKSNLNLNANSIKSLFGNNNEIALKLGEQNLVFENGEWRSGDNTSAYKSTHKMKQKLQQLEEENNFLKLKIEVLLNMLTETTAENYVKHQEIDKL